MMFFKNKDLLTNNSFYNYLSNTSIEVEDFFFDMWIALSATNSESSSNVDGFSHSPNFYDVVKNFDSWVSHEDTSSIYTASILDMKLYYPEPFIASPSFVHEEIWFLHILHYNYWLWFFFISLIFFYFVTFITVVRWCNLRVKPKRETRGVSRSKCADLITACVPVSWAASIIVSETVDATDYYDGFGTGEMVVGIRAYQWGWEYFYPKNIDLNYNLKPTYSTLIGNSLKYSTSTSQQVEVNNLWRYYQKTNSSYTANTPAHIILSPSDKEGVLNTLDFSSVGVSISQDAASFENIKKYSKLSTNNINYDLSTENNVFAELTNLYLDNFELSNSSLFYNLSRQHSYSSLDSFLPNFFTFLDNKSFTKYLNYTLNFNLGAFVSNRVLNYYSFFNQDTYSIPSLSNKKVLLLNSYLNKFNSFSLGSLNKSPRFFQNIDNINQKFNFSWNIFNTHKTFFYKDIKSPNQQFLGMDKTVRNILNTPTTHFNRDLSDYFNTTKSFFNTQILTNYTSSSLNWVDFGVLTKLLSSGLTYSNSTPSFFSNSLSWNLFDFDRISNLLKSDTTPILRGKEELTPDYILNSYWLSNWSGINLKHSFNLLNTNLTYKSYFYLPNILEYSEYDFKNWQSLDSLEDSIWETTYPSYPHDDYLKLKFSENMPLYFSNQVTDFNILNRFFTSKFDLLQKPFILEFFLDKVLSLSSDTFFLKLNLLNLLNFSYFNNISNFDSVDDSYDGLKSLHVLFYSFQKNLNFLKTTPPMTFSYTTNLNLFRANFEESTWSINDNFNLDFKNNFLFSSSSFLTNPIKLRSTLKNLMVTYNAIQKVYKSRFDEGRSNMPFSFLFNSHVTYPFLTEKRSSYENMLSKNSESFFYPSFFFKFFTPNFSTTTSFFQPLNYIFLDIPFLLSMKSDAARYLWFDWHSRWVSLEVQPSSIAKYSLAGLPYSSKLYDFSSSLGEELSDSQNYFSKLAHARKNYFQNWTSSPFFYLRIGKWLTSNFSYFNKTINLPDLKYLFCLTYDYWTSEFFEDTLSSIFTPSYSAVNKQNNVHWTPLYNISGYTYLYSSLVDILSKREYLYLLWFKNKFNSFLIPDFLSSSPRLTILTELKSIFTFVDPTLYSQEIGREFLLYNATLQNHVLLKKFLKKYSNFFFDLNLYDYFTLNNNFNFFNSLGNKEITQRSQYRPMRKGISNMVRLQATNAIAMPTEIRLHILASSKDVIHSWAIPSAGIKIDCVPGYSSHRVAIFLTHGIFWGQCMEICGRYHHWMPIVLYFIKRDLFFLWCTHFIHYSDSNNNFMSLEKVFTPVNKSISYDANTWLRS